MYKVFLSSTSRDLADYREAVHRALDGLPGFQLIRMEHFGARDANAKDLCVHLVPESNLFVGFMGPYYASCSAEADPALQLRAVRTRHSDLVLDDYPYA